MQVHRHTAARPGRSSPLGPRRNVRVLVAEDDPGTRSLLQALVSGEDGLELVAAVADAEAAIQATRIHEPDVCVLDVSMPRGGGPRAARAIRAACPKVRVIALSRHEDRDTVLEMLRAGVVGYVVKGASPEEIVESVRRPARGETALSAAVTSGSSASSPRTWRLPSVVSS